MVVFDDGVLDGVVSFQVQARVHLRRVQCGCPPAPGRDKASALGGWVVREPGSDIVVPEFREVTVDRCRVRRPIGYIGMVQCRKRAQSRRPNKMSPAVTDSINDASISYT